MGRALVIIARREPRAAPSPTASVVPIPCAVLVWTSNQRPLLPLLNRPRRGARRMNTEEGTQKYHDQIYRANS